MRGPLIARDKSLVQAVELWLPQGEVLAFGSGAFHAAHAGADRAGLRFHYGEGLPGAVWANGRALLWRDLPPTVAPNSLLAEHAVDAALGLPIFDNERLVAVAIFLLGNRSEAPGCLEIWDVTDELNVLRHGRGYYARCGEFERLSSFIQFQRGTGLPGLTWQEGAAVVMADVRQSNAFVRAGLAALCGLKHGIGLPIYRERSLIQVLALFGAERDSFVASAEIYRPHAGELGAATVFDWTGRGSSSGESSPDAPDRALAKQVLQSGTPALSTCKTAAGVEIVLALPIHHRKGLKEIVVLRF